jgi:hypothetical protein
VRLAWLRRRRPAGSRRRAASPGPSRLRSSTLDELTPKSSRSFVCSRMGRPRGRPPRRSSSVQRPSNTTSDTSTPSSRSTRATSSPKLSARCRSLPSRGNVATVARSPSRRVCLAQRCEGVRGAASRGCCRRRRSRPSFASLSPRGVPVAGAVRRRWCVGRLPKPRRSRAV